MRIKIGKLEFFPENEAEFDWVLDRYGAEIESDDSTKVEPKARRNASEGLDTHDRVILQRFVEAGTSGVTTSELGKLLGKRGRGTRGAANRWAVRVCLVNNENNNPFEECRVGSQRGLRIEGAHLGVAKELL